MTITSMAEFTEGYIPPVQNQEYAPGSQRKRDPQPLDVITADGKPFKPAGKLEGRSAIITGADSRICRSIPILIVRVSPGRCRPYVVLSSRRGRGQRCEESNSFQSKTSNSRKVLVSSDLTSESACQTLISKHIEFHGVLHTLILNHRTQSANADITTLSSDQWHATFDTNVLSFFYLTKAAIPDLEKCKESQPTIVINFAVGHPELLDYIATKGAMIAFCRGLSNQIVGEKGIRCNCSKKTFGESTPMGRAGQPVEIATCFVSLASADSSYISGQVIHANGGMVIN
ncbi:NAD(P)-binding protein [Athelia psychrophila]|uniref:NAD(P)-binding protein n=1 Tax=Athelia psychrophila TaxID=1759441 RepID=A0A166NS61_9AGAM|nr:NAD(P)-binding protein [Fibularhizoctonia sp. CBS 109695]